MTSKVFEKITEQFVKNQIINSEDRELYTYGLQQGAIIILNIMTTLLIGFLLGMIWQTILFMAAYLPLRSFAGGYHAKTQLKCFIFSMALTVAVLLGIKFIPLINFIILSISLAAAVIIYLLSPMEDKNKPLDKTEIAVYKKRARIILVIELCIVLLLMGLGKMEVSMCIGVSIFALSGMLMLGWLSTKNLDG